MSETVKFETLSDGLRRVLGTGPSIKVIPPKGLETKTVVKAHVGVIRNDELHELSDFVKKSKANVNISRSGTGITILLFH